MDPEHFVSMLDEHDLPEVVKVVAAWWECLGDGYACGFVALMSDSTEWYLEALCLDGDEVQYAPPKKVRTNGGKRLPPPILYVTALTWDVPVNYINDELDVVYCR